MIRQIFRRIKKSFKGRTYKDINPEDIFIDSKNLPGFEEHRFEGRIERPMGEKTFSFIKIIFAVVIIALASKLWILGIHKGDLYAQISENNRLEHTVVFANRGVIYDRNSVELATNMIKEKDGDFALRSYAAIEGLSHVIGYLKYPQADKSGVYYEENYKGREGVERTYEALLAGQNGLKLKETDVSGNLISESVVRNPQDGESLTLSIDAKVNERLFQGIKALAEERGFVGGAGVIMDVNTGEIIALTSYPEYDQNVMTDGSDRATINSLINSSRKPFLNRAIGGLYTPGSIIKPIIALSALTENIISPNKEILSTGSIKVPNPYDPEKPTIFGDWKAHGYTAMKEALAVSSDTYFYSIGGGYGDQKGLGITLLDKYFNEFGLTEKTGVNLIGEAQGVIATPEWKKKNFDGDIWRLGDTYITSIGQYGTQVTPINAARFISALANGGKVLNPSILKGGNSDPVERTIDFNPEDLKIVQSGMREGVTYGTSVGLNVPYASFAAKTGTAELGAGKKYVHSWSTGFFPYEHPKYAWAVIMDKGPSTNPFGATAVLRGLFDWMSINTPEYFQ